MGSYSPLRAAQELGGTNELRFLEAFQAPGWAWPVWYRGFRRARPEEDAKGIDAIIHTSAGDIPIQIKSSKGGKRAHEDRYGDVHVIIVMKKDLTAAAIRARTLALVGKRLKNRRKALKRKEKKRGA